MGLRDRGARKALVPIVVVAIGAGQIELALPPRKELTPLGDEGFKLRIVAGRDRNAARLLGDENGEREEVAALESKWLGLLMPRAFEIDARFEIDRVAQLLVEGRIARRHAFHGGAGVAMAIRAGLVRRALFLLPQGFAVEHPEHAGIGGVVILDRLGFRRHEAVARAALAWRNVAGAQ